VSVVLTATNKASPLRLADHIHARKSKKRLPPCERDPPTRGVLQSKMRHPLSRRSAGAPAATTSATSTLSARWREACAACTRDYLDSAAPPPRPDGGTREGRPAPSMPARHGKVRYFGVSNHSPAQMPLCRRCDPAPRRQPAPVEPADPILISEGMSSTSRATGGAGVRRWTIADYRHPRPGVGAGGWRRLLNPHPTRPARQGNGGPGRADGG
jgi:hypothetical protein